MASSHRIVRRIETTLSILKKRRRPSQLSGSKTFLRRRLHQKHVGRRKKCPSQLSGPKAE